MGILEKLFQVVALVAGVMIVTGGAIVHWTGGMVDLAKLEVPGIILTLIAFMLYKKNSQVFSVYSNRFDNFVSENGKNWFQCLVAIVVLMFFARTLRHYTLFTDLWDVVSVHQSLFYPFSPKILHCEVCRIGTVLGEHSMFTMLFLAPLTTFVHSDILVFAIKSATLFLGIWYLVRRGPLSNSKMIFLGLILFFASGALKGAFMWDFCEDDFGFVFLMFCAVNIYNNQLRWAIFNGLIACFSKENFPLSVAALALPMFFHQAIPAQRRKMIAVLWGVFFLGLLVVNLVFIVPAINKVSESQHNILLRLPGLGNTFGEAVLNLATTPSLWWTVFLSKLFSVDALRYVILLCAPFAWILSSKRAWLWAFPAFPAIFLNAISGTTNQRMMVFHYDFIILPFLALALFEALKTRTPTVKQAFMVVLVALVGFSYSPIFELTRYLPFAERIPSTVRLGLTSYEEPVLSDSKSMSHLAHLKYLRWMKVPEPDDVPSSDLSEFWRMFLDLNPPLKMGDQGIDIADAKVLVLNRLNNFQVQMESLLSPLSKSKKDLGLFAILEFEAPVLEVICKNAGVCRN